MAQAGPSPWLHQLNPHPWLDLGVPWVKMEAMAPSLATSQCQGQFCDQCCLNCLQVTGLLGGQGGQDPQKPSPIVRI
jgi:hypothetical protein